VAAPAEVIGAAMDDDGATNDAVRADQLDQLIGNAALGIPLAVRLKVTQVTDMALVVFGGTVGFVVGVEVRSGARAAVGVVTKGVDVHAALGVRIVAGNAPCNLGGGALVGLLKSHGALDVGVATQNGN